MNVMEISDWYGVVTLENKEWYILSVVVLFALQVYLFWRTK